MMKNGELMNNCFSIGDYVEYTRDGIPRIGIVTGVDSSITGLFVTHPCYYVKALDDKSIELHEEYNLRLCTSLNDRITELADL